MKLILTIIFALLMVQCSQKFTGKYYSITSGMRIYDNNIFYAYIIPANEPFTEFWGKWKKKNDTLILNSFKKPDNYHLICIKDSVDKNLGKDSVYIEVFLNYPNFNVNCKINNGEKYFLDLNNGFNLPLNFSKIVQGVSKIKTIQIKTSDYDYPVYNVSKNNTNFFQFKVDRPKSERYTYKHYEYYINEKFLLKNNSLKNLGYVGNTYSKVDSFPNYKMENFISCEEFEEYYNED